MLDVEFIYLLWSSSTNIFGMSQLGIVTMSKLLKSNQVWLGCIITGEESELLKKYCELNRRTQTDVVREFLRSLRQKVESKQSLSS